ncbi:MAG: amylo-alpha-1,6-glucosidase [Candidatus Sulfotelmatobacter sp.]
MVAAADQSGQSPELSRPVRPWEFVSAVGTRAAIFGNEQGDIEAWVYPLKVLRNFHLRFHIDGATIPAEALARTLIVHPESTTIVYTGDTFSVRETLFVPVHESGAVIAFEIDTAEPLEIEAVFERDFQLEWPASIGGVGEEWNPLLRAFLFGAESEKFHALVGSPSGVKGSEEYSTNYFSSPQDSIFLGATRKGSETKVIVIAAGLEGPASLAKLYSHLAMDYPALMGTSAAYYRDYLDRTISLKLPDHEIEKAYDWARVSMAQGLVQNPFLGEGLIAGFNTSGDGYRPGFAWFFGRDAEWTSLALDAEGDFSTTRQALDFLSKYQRADGKVPHEVSQSASFVDWFKTPFAYASADATPLFIIAVNDYVTHSGDIAFAQQKWDNLWRAYEFLQSTYDAQGLAQNVGVGTGWIEGGPLYPVRSEIYQASLGVKAARALSHLAHLLGKEGVSHALAQTFEKEEPILNQTFWSPENKIYAYAVDAHNNRIDVPSVLAAVPMWFEQLNGDQARSMIEELASPDQETDWGMRILSSRDPKYNPGGYHFGTVWPLFTGWASVGEYRYHRPLPAYLNLRANALLALNGSLGHVAEVLSGDYFQTLATGSPHQIWSAAMVVNPLLSGLLGFQVDAPSCQLNFAPHVPPDWSSFSVNNVRVGTMSLNMNYGRAPDAIRLELQSTGSTGKCSLRFSPALSLRARITGVRLNGRALPFHIEANSSDQHVTVNLPIVDNRNTIDIQMKNNFEIGVTPTLPELGGTSHGLRVLSQSWSPKRDTLTVLLSGASGETYELSAWNPAQVSSIEGARLEQKSGQLAKVRVQLPVSAPGVDPQATVIFHFAAK